MTLLVLYITLAIGISFLCSILEAVVLSLSPAYIYSLKNKKQKTYTILQSLTQNIERPLGAILTLNTIAHTIGAAGAGAQVQKVYGNEFFTSFSILLTFAILILSEIIPKSIGARYWKSLNGFAAFILPTMIIVTYPLVWISEKLSRIVRGSATDVITREEIDAVADLARSHGSLGKTEHLFLKRLLKFKDISAEKAMTPKEEVYALPMSTSIDEAFKVDDEHLFSRIPIYGVNKNDIKGYVLRSNILKAKALQKQIDLQEISSPMLIVPRETSIRAIMKKLIDRKEHICAVVNDVGDFIGIVTLEDIIEALLGIEIIDESDVQYSLE